MQYSTEALRRAMAAREWSNARLAEELTRIMGKTVSRSVVATWTHGRTPGGDFILAMAEAFGGLETLADGEPHTLAAYADAWRLIERDGGRYVLRPDGSERGPLSDAEARAMLACPAMMKNLL